MKRSHLFWLLALFPLGFAHAQLQSPAVQTPVAPRSPVTPSEAARGAVPAVPLVRVPPVQRIGARLPVAQEIRAQLQAQRQARLSADQAARVVQLHVREGDAVAAGAPLLSFDCQVQQAQQMQAQAALLLAQKKLEASQRRIGQESAGQAERTIVEAEVAKARAELNTLDLQLSRCTLKAPFAGQLVRLLVREQQTVQPGEALLEILDNGTLEVEFSLPAVRLADVRPGLEIQFIPAANGKRYPARIQRVAAQVDPATQTFKVAALLGGRFPELLSGMQGQVILPLPSR